MILKRKKVHFWLAHLIFQFNKHKKVIIIVIYIFLMESSLFMQRIVDWSLYMIDPYIYIKKYFTKMATKMVRHNTNNIYFSAFALGHHSINVIYIKVQLFTIKNYYIFFPTPFWNGIKLALNQLMNIQISEYEFNINFFFPSFKLP